MAKDNPCFEGTQRDRYTMLQTIAGPFAIEVVKEHRGLPGAEGQKSSMREVRTEK